GVADEVGALVPADGVAAQRGAGEDVSAEGHPHHGGAGADRERPHAAHLHGGAAPLVGLLDVVGLAAAAAQPTAHRRALGTQLALLGCLLRTCSGAHSFSLSSAGTLMCFGSTRPSGRAAANAESCDPYTGRSRRRAVAARLSIAALASASRLVSVTVAVTSMPNCTRPAPLASSCAVAAAARIARVSRAAGLLVEVTRNSAARRSDSTIAAARAASIGRYNSVTRLRAISRCGASSRARTPDWTLPRG